MPPTDISIIIVNYKSAAFTKACIHSLCSSEIRNSIEIIVVDNASYDGCSEMLKAEFPQVRFLQSDTNVGFAGANNHGASIASGKYLLFLNPDTEVEKSAVQELCDSLRAMTDAGIVGARLLNSDHSIQTTSVSSFPSILNQVFGVEWLRQKFPRLNLWGMEPLFEERVTPAKVETISGACMMMKREVFDQVAGFTTDYFMYAEDLDLCWKIQRAGWKVYYVPQAVIVHHGGQSSSARPENNYADLMIKESLYKFMRSRYGWWYAGTFRLSTGVGALCRLTLLLMLIPFRNIVGSRAEVAGALRKWVHIFFWCIRGQRLQHRRDVSGSRITSLPRAV